MFCCRDSGSVSKQPQTKIQEYIKKQISEAQLKPNNCEIEIDLRGEDLAQNPSDLKFLILQFKNFYKLYELKKLTLILSDTQIIKSQECLKHLYDILKSLPKSLEFFDLQLNDNQLGDANYSFYTKQIFENFKFLPQQLQTFHLGLRNNDMINSSFRFIGDEIKQIPKNIKSFRLDLDSNKQMGVNVFKYLPQTLQNIELQMNECNLGLNELESDFFDDLPQNLKSLNLGLQKNHFGNQSPYLQKLAQSFKNYSKNMENFTLNLNNNDLGKFIEDFQTLADGLKQLPKKINQLELHLAHNQLGNKMKNVENLLDILKSMVSIDQRSISLNLGGNNLGKYQEFRIIFPEVLEQLPQSTEKLCLGLQDNDLGDDVQNMKDLAMTFEKMDQNITQLEVNLSKNNLGDNEENVKYLEETLKGMMKFKQLVNIEIDLRDCKLEKSKQYLRKICNGLKQFPDTLRKVELKLNYSEINENDAKDMYTYIHSSHIFYSVRDQLQNYLPQDYKDMLNIQ